MNERTLAARIAEVKATLDAGYLEVQAIIEAADMYDCQAFGEAGEASLLEVIDSLADAGRVLISADELIESAQWHARKLGV